MIRQKYGDDFQKAMTAFHKWAIEYCNKMPTDDRVVEGHECQCEFTPYTDSNEESYHYLRRCQQCEGIWYSLHCPHDKVQNPCPACGNKNKPVAED